MQSLRHVVADASLSVTVAVHCSPRQGANPHLVTLYRRARPVCCVGLYSAARAGAGWGVRDVVQLGKVKVDAGRLDGEKEGKEENALLLALVCGRAPAEEDGWVASGGKKRDGNGVEIVGDDDDDDDDHDAGANGSDSGSESDSKSESDSDSDSDHALDGCRGEVVLVLATRSMIRIRKRLPLTSLPTYCPDVGMHPSTYVNKIVLAGTDHDAKADANADASSVSTARMILLNVRSGKVVHDFACLGGRSLDASSRLAADERVTVVEQSPAVDTVAVGTTMGNVHLVNLRHDARLFSLRHTRRTRSGPAPVRVTALSFRTDHAALQQGLAPLAVGRDDGDVSIWDLTPRSAGEFDGGGAAGAAGHQGAQRTLLTTLSDLHLGGVAHLTYLPNEPLLLSSGIRSNSLVTTIFDSPDHSGRTLRSRVGHSSPPSVARYLHPGSVGGGILANASDGTDASSCQILSAGGPADRTLRVFSTARSVIDKEYSQGRGLAKRARELGLEGGKTELLLPDITAFAICEARSRDWGDLVTIHRDHAMAYVWVTRRGAQSGPVLRQNSWNVSAMKIQPPVSCHATAVCLSSCGNFALVGTKGGTIYRYNVQSGMARGSYPRDATNSGSDGKGTGSGVAGSLERTMRMLEKKMRVDGISSLGDDYDADADMDEAKLARAKLDERRQAHLLLARHDDASVTGLAVDAVNRTLISVGSDSKLILWSFKTQAAHRKSPIYLPSPATMLRHVRDSDLAAIVLEDYSVLIFDCDLQNIVRRLGIQSFPSGPRHSAPITDVAFSPSGRRLLTASLDSTIRVWDVPTATCVDWMRFSSPPMSLTLSPTGEFLATTHADKVGISMWCDRSFFQTVHLDGGQYPTEPARMEDPVPLAEDSDDMDKNSTESDFGLDLLALEGNKQIEDSELESTNPTPKDDGLITLSGLPPAHWKNLFHLELVKERNKPKEAPKKPKEAPFFLQYRAGEGALGPNEEEKQLKDDGKDMEEWDAAWSDNEEDDRKMEDNSRIEPKSARKGNGSEEAVDPAFRSKISSWKKSAPDQDGKKRKLTHHRSHLATLLVKCYEDKANNYDAATEYFASLGPSAIDVALSTLCQGMHDLEEGLHLVHLASLWLLQAVEKRQNYEVVNAYLHRFLMLHAIVIAGIGEQPTEGDTLEYRSGANEDRIELLDTIAKLRKAQQEADEKLRGKMQHTLCLLRHFSRMV